MKIWHPGWCHTSIFKVKRYLLLYLFVMMRYIQLGSPLKHVASCFKFSTLKETAKFCRFMFSGVILKSPSSNIISYSLRYVKRLFDRFYKNRVILAWRLIDAYDNLFSFSYFFLRILLLYLCFLCEFNCLNTILSLRYKQRPPPKQYIPRRNILYPFLENWLLGKNLSVFVSEIRKISNVS